MAGLIKEDMRRSVDGVPGVKDLPVIGALFRSQEFQNSETEMVVIVTPLVVKPTSRANLALPTDGLAAPSDLRAVLLGQINEIYGVEGARPAGTYQGQYGYIIK
jgi:pilus assembly protein CpaC